jgi:Uri superfamily endonuclease
LAPGTYAYIGRARRLLPSRLRRHVGSRKTLFWHIDYLLVRAEIKSVWVRPESYDECGTARALEEAAAGWIPIPGFGASDCGCGGHLIFLPEAADGGRLLEQRSFKEVNLNDLFL